MKKIDIKNHVANEDNAIELIRVGEFNKEGYCEGIGFSVYNNGWFDMGSYSNGYLDGFAIKYKSQLELGFFEENQLNGIGAIDEGFNSFRFGIYKEGKANGLNFRILPSKDWLVCKYHDDKREGLGLVHLSFFNQLFEAEFSNSEIKRLKPIGEKIDMEVFFESFSCQSLCKTLKEGYPFVFTRDEGINDQENAWESWKSSGDGTICMYQWGDGEHHINLAPKGAPGTRNGLGVAFWGDSCHYFSNFNDYKQNGTTFILNSSNTSGAMELYEDDKAKNAVKFIINGPEAIAYNPCIDKGVLFREDGTYAFIKDLQGSVYDRYSYTSLSGASLDEASLRQAMDELEALEGLSSVKTQMRDLITQVKTFGIRKKYGLCTPNISYHMVFTGNPGTGKTTVARIVGKIYHALGLLSKGQTVEVDREGLVGQYIGHTAVKTKEAIHQAMGGVLFVDEAYALKRSDSHGWDFGVEAIDTLVKAMEDLREDLIVIVAGYKNEMETFINANPGLRSRFKTYVDFEDYSGEALLNIFNKLLNKNEYTISVEALELVKEYLADKNKNKFTGNARDVRNLFEKIVQLQARRIPKLKKPTKECVAMIIKEDLPFEQKNK